MSVAAPDFVPTDPNRPVRMYSSPPRRPDSWQGGRPGELTGGQPRGAHLGTMGPDQGYAYRLVGVVEEGAHYGAVEREDAVAGCVAVAMKRAALFGRGPVVHDLTAAYTVFGFLDDDPDAELVELRQRLFAEVRSGHHYAERRDLVDRVADEALRQTHQAIATRYQSDWRANLVET